MGRYSLFVFGAAIAGYILYAATAHAVTVPVWEDVYDGTASASTYSNNPRQSWHHGTCTEEEGILERQTSRLTTQLCVTHTPQLSLASHFPPGGAEGSVEYAVKKTGDDVYHLLTNIHTPAQPVLLADGTLFSSSLHDSTSLKLFKAKNVHEKLIEKRTQTGLESFNKTYVLDEEQVEFIEDIDDNMIFSRAIAVSQNREFAVTEVYGRGIVTINLDSGEVRMISTDRVSEYNEPNGNMRLAISNDGKKVFAVSSKTSLYRLYLTDGYCGRESAQLSTGIEWPCDYIDFKDKLHAELRSNDIFYADIAEDLKAVSLYSWSESDKGRVKTTLRPDSNSKRLEYLALGDSYSSGEGDTEKNSFGDKYYRSLTNREENRSAGTPREKCHVSIRSYPYRLAIGMDLALDDPKQWDTVACSGATAWDIKTQATDEYEGQGNRLRGYDYHSLKEDGLESFIPGRQKQIEFVRKYKPKAITITAGGNDVGFAKRLEACVTSFMPNDSCDSATQTGRLRFGKQIKDQYDNLKSLYTELRKASAARTKIYVVGYPVFMSGKEIDVYSCGDNIGSLNNNEREMIESAVVYLNNTIEQAAVAAGVKYLDIEDSLVGGRLCDQGQENVTGISFVGDNELQESFHPNAKGNYRMAMSIWGAVGSENLLDYTVCHGSISIICPDVSATKDDIEVPPYFQGPEPSGTTTYQQMTWLDFIKGGLARIGIPQGILAPSSVITIVMHSEPVSIGEYTVDSEGAFETDISVPNGVPAGYHTLIVKGQGVSGEPLELEQIVLVLGSDVNDRDEDGVADAQQACGPFIQVSGADSDNDGIDDACDPEISEGSESPITSPTPTPSITPSPSPTPNPGESGSENVIVSFITQLITIVIGIIKILIMAIQKIFTSM